MKITLTIWERAQLAIIVGSGSAPTIEGVRLGLQALAMLNLSDEEKIEIGWTMTGPNQFGWTKSREYELDFEEDVWRMIQALVRAPQARPIDERTEPLYDKVMEAK